MRIAGILILLLGLILVVAGIAMVVSSVFALKSSVEEFMESRVVKSVPLTVDQPTTSALIDVNKEKMCQIVVQADLSGTDVEEKQTGADTSYQLEYKIPLEVEVFDDKGNSIYQESRTLDGEGFVMTLNRSVTEDGGSETPRVMLGTFQPPASGKVSLTATIGKNRGGDIAIKSAQVDVLDNVTQSAGQAAGGLLGICCGGPTVSGFGLLLLIIGAIISLAARTRSAPPPPGQTIT
jgi:hypothetical protein